ncbi:MAG TPA: flagellar biosynthesis anti-sigma factor FlgM [Granulicella sp.]
MNTNGIHVLTLPLQQALPAQRPAAEENNASYAGSSAPQVSDQTTLSPVSTLLAQALTTSDVRMDKVQSLQQSIAAGTYNVPSSEVAGKMIDSLLN